MTPDKLGNKSILQKSILSGRPRWLTPVILATWRVEIWRILVQDQSGQKTHKISSELMARLSGSWISSQLLHKVQTGGAGVQPYLGIQGDPALKITNVKRRMGLKWQSDCLARSRP
jgi:hypothetical protein